jgi:DNA (cytosine-5)-methyltransferase 1
MRVDQEMTTVVLADPPWPHANGSRTNSGKSPKYPLMNLREIEALGDTVANLVGDHAILYMWATAPHLPGALAVISAWGFVYRSYLIWKKTKISCGFWARSNAEIVLISERGRPCAPARETLPATVFSAQPVEARHSSKPDWLHSLVEQSWPGARKIELFARTERIGWTCYGSDLGHKILPSGVTIGGGHG